MDAPELVDGNSVFRRSPDIVSRQVGPESILVPVRHTAGALDFIYTLSPVAARVWDLLDGTRSVDAIVAVLCEEFEVSRERAAEDVAELVNDLSGVSLVTRIA